MPTEIDAARAALGAAKTAAASSPITNSPDINIPVDRRNRLWSADCLMVLNPSGSQSEMTLPKFWFAALDESDRLNV
jgi:hypothetical protein